MCEESSELQDVLTSNLKLSVDLLQQSIDDMNDFVNHATLNAETKTFLLKEIQKLEQLKENLIRLQDGRTSEKS
ncbi:MAG: hypothetical protein HY711_05390 [Candidatus Melainabacteria bacterium]|nr:hypothetical protein [Candidatus Melainabacteria bacterium]